MGPSIFYSWQMDAPLDLNRHFIRTCLDRAVEQLALDAEIDDSPRVDSGMEGVSGTPEVAAVMFDKIDQSHIFVADVSLVGSIPSPQIADSKILNKLQSLVLNKMGLELYRAGGKKKRIPNSNVVLEMGYAAGVLGWERIICVMNEYLGKKEEQPFDVRNRRFPIDYTLSPGNFANKKEVERDLVSVLKRAIRTVLGNENRRAKEALRCLDLDCFFLMYTFGKSPYFSETDFNHESFVNERHRFPPATRRLIELRLLWTDHDPEKGLYAYHWTQLGKEVLKLALPKT